ncbi:MAG TPA: NrsF family protein [Polyangiaceae bacterium]|jgi:hypothetical protein|nr:NrsF family protein [Polyangiaceae bacterium]
MKDPFDIHRIADVPDPLSDVDDWPLPSRRDVALAASPTRSRMATARATALGAALLYELAWLVVMSKRDDLHTTPRAVLLTELAIPVMAALLALFAATPGALGLGQPKGRMTVLALLAPALFVAATVVMSPGGADAEPFFMHSLRCFAWTAVYSIGPMVFAAWAFRRSFVGAPVWRSAALGMACGAVGAATMSLVCAVGSPAHVLVGHGGMMLVGAAAGAWLGNRFGRV